MAVALVVVAAILGGPVIRALHYAHVQHVRCAEHGELVHAGDPGHATPAKETSQARGRVHGTGAAEHGHDHCAIAFAERPRGEVDRTAAVPAIALDLTGSARPAIAPALARSALYRLAPKNSPPA